MKRISVFFLAFCAILSCGCSANNPEIVENTTESSTAATTTATLAETTAETTMTTTSAETTTAATATTAAETTTTTTTAETTTTTPATTTAPAATTSESTVITTAETTTEKATAASTEIVTTTVTKKTKKTKKTTTAVSKEPETTELTTTTETTVSDETPLPVTFEQQADGSLLISGERYVMTFDDEFNGSNLDLTKWSRCPEWKRQDRNCYWNNDCSYLNGEGQLVLEATYDGDYYMGAIRSKGKFEQAYGYFEVKCTLNTTPGWWTAFWLMGETVQEGNSGAQGTEIDIYESAFYYDNEVQHTLNWGGYGAGHQASGSRTKIDGLYDGDYHTFSLLWTEEEYVFFIDGEETWRTDAAEAGGTCTAPLYLKMTAETGSWTYDDMDELLLPDSILVDYIRVYQKS